MSASKDSSSAPYNDVAAVPIGIFRHYMNFIVRHDLWDGATEALQAAGINNVVLGGLHVKIIREFVDAKGVELNNDPAHAGTLVVPECSILCPPPKTPVTTTTDGGAPDGGTP
ncbi:hypothetical protein EDD96_6677 [Streptomyces sp. Ag109_G2-6]|uniref:hypothetical protein n=1 Tax=Streptomyces TaxID=1883 RepID=UPI0009A4E806|nr:MULTISPECIES: hypothetical protein [Streptomyces]RPF30114.1 hypothetical protein EDD96_6677 [Streptomyces sp. Ag109_G2-6]